MFFKLGKLKDFLLYTDFWVLTNLESIKSLIPYILFLRAVNLPTEYSLPQQERGFYLLDHSITLLAVNRKLAWQARGLALRESRNLYDSKSLYLFLIHAQG